MAKILVVDDDELVRAKLRNRMKNYGHEVAAMNTDENALYRYGREAFDLVITDILMPEMEGIETISKLKQMSPSVKIIAISGGGRKGNLEFLAMAGKLGA